MAGTLDAIVGSVGQVSDVVGEITRASTEQADELERVNQRVVEVDALAQRAAASSNESSHTAGALSCRPGSSHASSAGSVSARSAPRRDLLPAPARSGA